MKKVILVCFLMPYLAYGQVVENFEPGVLTHWEQYSGGRWAADTSGSISGRYSLHHVYDNPDAGTDQAGMLIDSLHPAEGTVHWSFAIRHGYDPSSSNNWSVLLMSDSGPGTAVTGADLNGYALGVNIEGYDDILRLYKIKDGTPTAVVNTGINWQESVGSSLSACLEVERTVSGTWTVTARLKSGEMLGSASGTDNELFSCKWFMVCYSYSSGRDRLLWFDDLEIDGTFFRDYTPPAVSGCWSYGNNSVRLILNDQPGDDFALPTNFVLDPEGINPISVFREGGTRYRLTFTGGFQNRSDHTLTISRLCSGNGSCSNNVKINFTAAWPETGDVIISEIMADPEPSVSLPPVEYFEIMNRTSFMFSMDGWTIRAGEQSYILPSYSINPSEFIIVCNSRDTSLFSFYGRTLGLKQFPTLTDDGKMLLLFDESGRMIHGLEYSSSWYNSELKSKGGWSLEMIDTGYPFFYKNNWTASVSKRGGTPGSVNSVNGRNPDLTFAGSLNVFPADCLNIIINSPEPLFSFAGMAGNISIDGKSPPEISPDDPLLRSFAIRLDDPLLPGKIYQLELESPVMDFAGNMLMKNIYDFSLTRPASPGDLLFNELLFNPFPGDPDYIELYNVSEKAIDASRLEMISISDASGDTSAIYPVSDLHRCILPGTYYALTTDPDKISDRYFSADPDFIFVSPGLPSMPDEKGHLVLFSRELERIDGVSYSQKMQSALLSGYQGVALEKIIPGSKSEDAGNWHSATEISGWGTPGARNSVYAGQPVTDEIVSLSSPKITPDADGLEDVLTIKFALTGNANIVSVNIFDETGGFVKKVVANVYAGPDTVIIWDGTADDGSMVRTGVYIILIEMFDESGRSRRWKKVCTVISR